MARKRTSTTPTAETVAEAIWSLPTTEQLKLWAVLSKDPRAPFHQAFLDAIYAIGEVAKMPRKKDQQNLEAALQRLAPFMQKEWRSKTYEAVQRLIEQDGMAWKTLDDWVDIIDRLLALDGWLVCKKPEGGDAMSPGEKEAYCKKHKPQPASLRRKFSDWLKEHRPG